MIETSFVPSNFIFLRPQWINDVFLPSLLHVSRPIVLFADGHLKSFSEDVYDLLKENKIIFYPMRFRSENLCQPLDLVFHKLFKKEWSWSKETFKQYLPQGVVHQDMFPTVYRASWERTYKRQALIDSFERVNLCPWYSGLDEKLEVLSWKFIE